MELFVIFLSVSSQEDNGAMVKQDSFVMCFLVDNAKYLVANCQHSQWKIKGLKGFEIKGVKIKRSKFAR